DGKSSSFHNYRRYWSVWMGAFLVRSLLGLAFVMIFDWFNMDPYDLFSMIYAIGYAAATIVMVFCIAGIIKIPNPLNKNTHESQQEIPMKDSVVTCPPANP